jgi:RNA polymerase sigma-70 factor (ECF subfamily)
MSMLENEEDRETFTKIYEQFRLPCYHVALKLTQNHEMAEDAVQNAFLAIIKHKDKIFDLPSEQQKSKVSIITKNKAIDLIRMEKIRNYTPIDEVEDDASVDDFDFDVSKIVEGQESYENLISCISSLPEKYKSVVEMRYVHDMSNQKIAKLLDITPKAVSMRLNRAKTMLQELLIKRGEK